MRRLSPLTWICFCAVLAVILGGGSCKHTHRADFAWTGTPAAYSAVTAGNSITITGTVLNKGNKISNGYVVRAYLTKNSVLDSTAVLLGTSPVQSALLVGQSHALAGWNVTIPGGGSPTLPGVYKVIVFVDAQGGTSESDEYNNMAVSDLTVLSGTGITDLSVTNLSLNVTSLTRGQSLNATWGFVNLGDQASPPLADNGFYLSTDTVFDGADTYLGVSVAPTYSAGSTASGTSALTIPPTVAAGSYYILFVLDRTSAVTESDEFNNVMAQPVTVVASTGVDYVVANTGSNRTVGRGGTFQVTPLAANAGSTTATNAVRVGAYLSSASVTTIGTVGNALVGSGGVGPLTAGASANATINVTIPAALPLGTYYLGYVVDDLGQEAEINETNNGSSVVTLTVVADDSFEDNDTIANAATISTNTLYTNLTVIQSDDDWYRVTLGGGTNTLIASISNTVPGDAIIEIYDGTGTLIGGGAVTGSGWSGTISGLAAGNYYLKVSIVNGTTVLYNMSAGTTSPVTGEGDSGAAGATAAPAPAPAATPADEF